MTSSSPKIILGRIFSVFSRTKSGMHDEGTIGTKDQKNWKENNLKENLNIQIQHGIEEDQLKQGKHKKQNKNKKSTSQQDSNIYRSKSLNSKFNGKSPPASLSPRKKWKEVLQTSQDHEINIYRDQKHKKTKIKLKKKRKNKRNEDTLNSKSDDNPKTNVTSDKGYSSYTHLVVLQHGLHGDGDDFIFFQAMLEKAFESENETTSKVLIFSTKCNAFSLLCTHDGIDTGGKRLADEIVQMSEKLTNLTKFSIIGHSLGGLYARYAIGILQARGYFDKIEPMNFISIATPHLGIRRPYRGSFNLLFNAIAPMLFSRTGSQFTLTDNASQYTQDLANDRKPTTPKRESTKHHTTSTTKTTTDLEVEMCATVIPSSPSNESTIEISLDDLEVENDLSHVLDSNEKRDENEISQDVIKRYAFDDINEFNNLPPAHIKFSKHIWRKMMHSNGLNHQAMSGKKVVDWMLNANITTNRAKAVEYGSWLVLGRMLKPQDDNEYWEFDDSDNLYYKCIGNLDALSSSSSSFISSIEKITASELIPLSSSAGIIPIRTSKLGTLDERFCVLVPDQHTLFIFDHPLDIYPKYSFYLLDANASICITKDEMIDIIIETMDLKSSCIELRITHVNDNVNEYPHNEEKKKNTHDHPDQKTTQWHWLVNLLSMGVNCTNVVDLRYEQETKTNQNLKGSTFMVNDSSSIDKQRNLPLLVCLTRGMFIQGLKRFQCRSLYSNIFYDMQVPYSSAAIRSHNPYRSDPTHCPTSFIYPHITLESLIHTPIILRDVQKRISLEYNSPLHALLPNERYRNNNNNINQFSPTQTHQRRMKLIHRSTMGFDQIKKLNICLKSKPHVQDCYYGKGTIIMDNIMECFCSDPDRDYIRSMLLSLQSLGYCRMDCLFDGVMAHERIIAKRSHLYSPNDSGIDISCHIADTFLL